MSAPIARVRFLGGGRVAARVFLRASAETFARPAADPHPFTPMRRPLEDRAYDVFGILIQGHNAARIHLPLAARHALRRPPRNRLKIGVRREGTVSDDLLETRRLIGSLASQAPSGRI